MSTFSALLQSRKVWIGLVTVLAIATATLLRALDKIPADALLPTISGICLTGGTLIGSIAWEDTASKRTKALTAIVKRLPTPDEDTHNAE